MKKLILAMVASLAIFSSCSEKYPSFSWTYYPNMLVTVKSEIDGTCYFQLDDNTTLRPENMTTSPFKGEVRALANCTEVPGIPDPYDKIVRVNWIDEVLTKDAVPTKYDENDQVYGNDPIEILDDWVTVVEDGYLTINFCALFGSKMVPHELNLVTGVDPTDPYAVELRHNAKGDYYHLERRSGVAAFDISSLPDTNGRIVELSVRYKGFNGNKTAIFDYCTGGIISAPSSVPMKLDEGVNVN